MSGRILALDYGEKRVGVALSDPLQIFAKPFCTLPNSSIQSLIADIKQLCSQHNVSEIVVGVPYAIDGGNTPKTLETLDFIQALQSTQSLPITKWDERYSSQEAEAELKKMGKSWQEARQLVDAMAAALILKNYLENKN